MMQAMSDDPTWRSLTSPEMLEVFTAAEIGLEDLVSEPFWKQRMLLPQKQFLNWAKTMNAAKLIKASKTAEVKQS